MANNTLPDITFVNADTEQLVNALIASFEAFTGRTLYPADPARLFILWMADILIQERVIINESAKQNVPRYAEGEYLDSLAELFKDTERLQARPAQTTIRFYLSAPQTSTQIIQRGTRITVDGEITFETEETINISPGELYGDAPAICQVAGAVGNGFVPGQINQIVDLYAFYERVENITTSEGGADAETDVAFYSRLRDSMESFSTAGSVGAYIYWVKSASQKITDVKPTSPTPGVVDIRILLENGEFPDTEIIQEIYKTLEGEIPLTDTVYVSEPDTRPFDVDITYYLPRQQEDSTAIVKAAAEQAVEAYIKWQTEKMGRDINPDELRYMLKAAGVKRIELNAPAFEIIKDNEVAALVNLNVIYGGVEDD